jgi:hypothetical protein
MQVKPVGLGNHDTAPTGIIEDKLSYLMSKYYVVVVIKLIAM